MSIFFKSEDHLMNRKSETELRQELDQALDTIEDLEEKMDAIIGIAAEEDAYADTDEEPAADED